MSLNIGRTGGGHAASPGSEPLGDAGPTASPVRDLVDEADSQQPNWLKRGLKLLLVLIGVTGLAASIMWAGVDEVVREISSAGWLLLPLGALHLVPIVFDAAAWRTLTPPKPPPLRVFAMARWVREGVNALIPGAQIGGEVVGARMLSRAGQSAGSAGVVVSIDLATEFFSMVIVGLAGAFALYELAPVAEKGKAALVSWAIAPPAVLAIIVLFVQRTPWLDAAARWAAPRWPRTAQRLVAAQDTLSTVWSRPKQLVLAIGFHSAGWIGGAFETWVMLLALGHRVGFAQAFALETTSEVIRSFGFAIPGLLGAQEASLIVVGTLLGVPPAGAVALSLFRRARDIGLGLPALALWYVAEYTGYGRNARPRTPHRAPLSLIDGEIGVSAKPDGDRLAPRPPRRRSSWRFMMPWDIGLFLGSARTDARLAEMIAAGAPRSTALDRLYAEAPQCDPWRSASPNYFYQRNKYDNLIGLLPSARRFHRSLDIGCGTGLLTERLHAISRDVVGIDLSATAVRLARERFKGRANSHFRQADLLDLDATFEGAFDLVVVADVIYYLPPAALTNEGLTHLASRLARLLRPDGVLLVANHYASRIEPSSRVSRRIHEAFRSSHVLDLTIERWRPFWLAGLFAPAEQADPSRSAFRLSADLDHEIAASPYVPKRTRSEQF